MEIHRPSFVPDPALSRDEMESLQHDIASAAVFEDVLEFDPGAVAPDGRDDAGDSPLIAGVDQAFRGDEAVSAVVVMQDGEVVERAHAVEPTEIPYVPGLLSFREGNAVLSALQTLDTEPALLLVDGSGRIHYREAGLATHIGVTVDVPTVGVAKRLLCGRPRQSLDEKLAVGARVGIEADDEVTAPDGTLLGYAVQTRQFDSPDRHINPLYVSPGHRVGAETAATLVERTCDTFKHPEPTRLADSLADERTRE